MIGYGSLHEDPDFMAKLREESPYFPNVLLKQVTNRLGEEMIFASTLVRIPCEGVWYTMHCSERIILSAFVKPQHLVVRLLEVAYQTQHLYVINPKERRLWEEVDQCQSSEPERLTQLYYQQRGINQIISH